MKICMQTLAAGPMGVAKPGTVVDLPQAQAEELITRNYARLYDKERDRKAKQGFEVAKTGDD